MLAAGIVWLCLGLSTPVLLTAQDSPADLFDLSLDQLTTLRISSAAKRSERISDIPSSIIIITAQRIRERGYHTLDDVVEDLPGFQLRNIQGINSYLFQRGIPNQNNLILLLIDGIQVNELNSGGFYAGALYPLTALERIEVIYGPSSVAYGTNAVSGIINLVTRNAYSPQRGGSFSAGSFDARAADLRYAFAADDSSLAITVSGATASPAKGDIQGAEGDRQWTDRLDNFERNYSGNITLHYKALTAGTDILYREASTATLTKSVGTVYKDYGSSWNILFLNHYAKLHIPLSDAVVASGIVYHRRSNVLRNTIYAVVDTAQIGYYRPNALTGLEFVMTHHVPGPLLITGGMTMEFESLARSPSLSLSSGPDVPPALPPDPEQVRNNLTSVFVEPKYSPVEEITISGGIRIDHSSVYHTVMTPRAGAVYRLSDHTLRISYGEAFRAPKPWDYSDGAGNIQLKPEHMRSYEAGYSFTLSGTSLLDLSLYRNRLSNAFMRVPAGTSYRWVNTGEYRTLGMEISLQHRIRSVEGEVRYSYTGSTDEHGNEVAEISPHTASGALTYTPVPWVTMNVRGIYTGRRNNPKIIPSAGTRTIEAAQVFHAVVNAGESEGVYGRLTIRNLFNATYFHPSNRDPDWYRQPQRSFILTVGYTLRNAK